MEKKYHILIAEDLKTDTELAEREVRKVLPDSVFRFVETEEEFIKELNEFNPDLIISDYKMPAFTGLRALKITLEKSYLTPLIILTGSMNEDTAVECMKAGATDYVIKEHIRRLGTAVVNALEKKKNIIERAKYQNELFKSEERFRRLAENADDLIYRYDFLPTPKFTYVSPAAFKITGYTPEEHYADPKLGFKLVHPDDRHLLEKLQIGYENLRKPIIFRWIKKNGEIIWTEQKNIPILNNNGEIEAIEGIARDITERKKAEDERINQEKLYRTLFDLSPAGIMLEDLDGNIIDCNDNYLKTTGYSREELVGQNVRKIVPPEFLPDVDEHIVEIKTGKTLSYEVQTLIKDGSRRYVELQETMITFPNGKKGIIVVTNDITDRKNAEESLKANESKYRTLFEGANDAIFIMKGFEFLDCNDMTLNIFGCEKKEDIISKFPWDYSPILQPDGKLSKEKASEYIQSTLQGIKQTFYWKHRRKDGKTFDAEVTLDKLALGSEIFVQAVVRDITERKTAEETINKRLLFEKIIALISTKFITVQPSDIDEEISSALKEVGEATDSDRSYLFLFSEDSLTCDNTHEWCAEGIEPQIDNLKGIPISVVPWWMENLRNFKTIHVPLVSEMPEEAYNEKEILESQDIKSVVVIPLVSDKSLIGFIGFDSVRKVKYWVEEDLILLRMLGEIFVNAFNRLRDDVLIRESEEKIRLIFNSTAEGIYGLDKEGLCTFCNNASLSLLGYNVDDELIGKNMHDLIHHSKVDGSHLDEEECKIYNCFKLGLKAHVESEVFWKKNGTFFPVEYWSYPIYKGDEVIGAVVTFNDITERKKAEETIAASEANYKYLFENNPHPMWVYELETLKFLAANDTAVNKYGYSREEFLTMTLKDIRPIDEIELLEKNIATFNNSEYQKSGPWRHQFKSGEIIFVEITSHSIEFDGKKARLVIANDITVKLHAEEALRKSEERYRKIFDDDLTGDFIATPDGTLLLGNPALAEILGYDSVDSLMDINMKDIYPSIDYREKLLNLIYEKKKLTLYEHQLKKRDGTLITVLENVIGEFNEKGELTQIKGYILDITSRKEAEENIRKLSRGVEQSPTSIIITDCNGNIEYVNPKLETVTGYKSEELIGKNPRIFNFGDKTKEDYKLMWDTIISGEEWHGEFHNKKKNGELYWESASISPIFDEKGKITHFIALKEDITKQKEMITELITAKDKAEEMSRVKSYFFANMSHELRTPLIGILGFSEVLQEILSADPEKRKMAKTIHTSGLRLLETLNNILRISKIEADRVAYELKDLDIVPVLEGVVELFSKTAKEAGMELEFTYSEESIICTTDKNLLREIMNNLVNNAIKFSEGGSVKVVVEKQEEIARINVIDQGIGIPIDKQELIWEAFRQVSEGLSRGFEGTGLGLTISKKYAELIRSKIYFKSEEGKGTTFTIELPLSNEEQI